MAIPLNIPTLPNKFTAGDLEDPITVKWNVPITVESSELVIDRPGSSSTITVVGVLLTASTGLFEYPWAAGDLVAGKDQLVKARLFDAAAQTGRRKSTEYFKIDVDEDLS